jgi:hypothetical protein
MMRAERLGKWQKKEKFGSASSTEGTLISVSLQYNLIKAAKHHTTQRHSEQYSFLHSKISNDAIYSNTSYENYIGVNSTLAPCQEEWGDNPFKEIDAEIRSEHTHLILQSIYTEIT